MTHADVLPLLPSSDSLARLLAGLPLLPHRQPQIIDAVGKLLALQRRHRLALADLTIAELPAAILREAAFTAMTAAADIDHVIERIDTEIATRLSDTVSAPEFLTTHPSTPMHTESVGRVLSRIACLAEIVNDHRDGTEHLPAALELDNLLVAYEHLRRELASGARRVPYRI